MTAAVASGRPIAAEHHLGLVYMHARRVARRARHLELEDLAQEGVIGLMRAIELFDPERGVKFSTYASIWIRQAIGRALADKEREIRLPVYVQARGVDFERRCSLSSPVGEHGGTLEGVLPSTSDVLEETHDHVESGRLSEALETLGVRHRSVIRRRLEGCTLNEVAGELGVSRERARQIQEEAVTLVRRRLQPTASEAGDPCFRSSAVGERPKRGESSLGSLRSRA